MRKLIALLLLGMLLASLTACAAGGDEDASTGSPAGFWLGLWHGGIAPLTFVISLFNKNVGVYATHNNGGWYNSGFIFGLLIALGGGRNAGHRAWHRKARGKAAPGGSSDGS